MLHNVVISNRPAVSPPPGRPLGAWALGRRADEPGQPDEASSPLPGDDFDPGPLRVLVVDDNVDSAQALCWLLEAVGFEARPAYDGETALREARDFAPRAILLDLGLPTLDGFEVASRLRLDPATGGITLVAISGYTQEDDRHRSTASGFDHHLAKPVEFDQLLRLLKSLPPR